MRPAARRLLAGCAALTASALVLTASLQDTFADSDGPPPDHEPAPEAIRSARIDAGREAFDTLWSVAPSAFGVWGRGPTSNAERCADCHPAPGEALAADALLARLAVPRQDSRLVPHPAYGMQLQTRGVLGRVPAEGVLHVQWEESTVTLDDGTPVALRAPRAQLDGLAFGPLDGARVSLRRALPLHGVGLLEAVPGAVLESLAAVPAAPGVHGRVSRVPDPTVNTPAIGRFGHKAAHPSLFAQAAAALHQDIGVTSPLHPWQNCPAAQRECLAAGDPGALEAGQRLVEDLAIFLATLPAPPRQAGTHPDGERLFETLGCAACHRPVLPVAGIPGTAQVRAWTDLLLHDLGEGLDDGVAEHDAEPRLWRTAPLWGLARRHGDGLLHDSRARCVEEAILWHGGEAATARHRYAALPAGARAALLRFLESL
jgi:CxxC motif-containing protein (DUF1111 family)